MQALDFTPQQAGALAALKQGHLREMEALRTRRLQLFATLQVPSVKASDVEPTAIALSHSPLKAAAHAHAGDMFVSATPANSRGMVVVYSLRKWRRSCSLLGVYARLLPCLWMGFRQEALEVPATDRQQLMLEAHRSAHAAMARLRESVREEHTALMQVPVHVQHTTCGKPGPEVASECHVQA